MCIYDPDKLMEMAQNYLATEDYYRQFIREHTEPFYPGSRCTRLNLDKDDSHTWYFVYQKESSCAFDALRTACQMINADMAKVLATAKAMNRYERHHNWEVCAHLPNSYSYSTHEYGDERTRRFFAEADSDALYFISTGRRKPWAVD